MTPESFICTTLLVVWLVLLIYRMLDHYPIVVAMVYATFETLFALMVGSSLGILVTSALVGELYVPDWH